MALKKGLYHTYTMISAIVVSSVREFFLRKVYLNDPILFSNSQNRRSDKRFAITIIFNGHCAFV